MKTDEDFFNIFTTEYNQVLLKELQSQEDTGSTLPEDMCPWSGCMYETFGKELEYVKAQPPKRIWTIVDEDGELYISAGYHFVNRLGYLITDTEWEDEFEIYLVD